MGGLGLVRYSPVLWIFGGNNPRRLSSKATGSRKPSNLIWSVPLAKTARGRGQNGLTWATNNWLRAWIRTKAASVPHQSFRDRLSSIFYFDTGFAWGPSEPAIWRGFP